MKRLHLAGWVLGLVLAALACDVRDARADDEVPAEPAEKPPEEPSLLKTLGSYALALIGVGMLVPPLIKASQGSVSYPMARLQLTNLLRSNPYQAAAVCKSLKGTFQEALGAALVTGGMTQSRDLKVITSATRPTYDGTATGVAALWKASLAKGKLGMMAAAGGVAISLSGGSAPVIVILIGVVALAMFGYLLWRKFELDRSIVVARAELLPEVERTIAEGRFVLAPPS